MPYLWWVDDGREVVDSEHAQVGHGERAAHELLGLELPITGTARQLAHLLADGAHGLGVGTAHDGRDEALQVVWPSWHSFEIAFARAKGRQGCSKLELGMQGNCMPSCRQVHHGKVCLPEPCNLHANKPHAPCLLQQPR